MAKTNERHRPHGFAYAPKGVRPAQVSTFGSFAFVLVLMAVGFASGVRPDKNFASSQQPETARLQSMRGTPELEGQEQNQDARGFESSGRRRTRRSKGLLLAASRAHTAPWPVDATKYTNTTVLSSGVRIGNIVSTPVHFGVHLQPTNASSIPVRTTNYPCDRTPLGAHGSINPFTDESDGCNSDQHPGQGYTIRVHAGYPGRDESIFVKGVSLERIPPPREPTHSGEANSCVYGTEGGLTPPMALPPPVVPAHEVLARRVRQEYAHVALGRRPSHRGGDPDVAESASVQTQTMTPRINTGAVGTKGAMVHESQGRGEPGNYGP